MKDLRDVTSLFDEMNSVVQNNDQNKLFEEVVRLREQITKKDEEIAHLKDLLLHSSVPAIEKKNDDLKDAELICRTQLNLFANKAAQGIELTSDESKKIDIFAKLLLQITGKEVKEKDTKLKQYKASDLLEMLES